MDKVDVLITDKTGTLTQGKPSVETVFSQRGNADDLLQKLNYKEYLNRLYSQICL
jgi:Cu2+-exporting ATPase